MAQERNSRSWAVLLVNHQENVMRDRAELERAIRSGGSVMIGDRIVTRIEDLPSAAELAVQSRDPRAAAAERVRLQAEIDRLNQELGLVLAHAETPTPQDEVPVQPRAGELEQLQLTSDAPAEAPVQPGPAVGETAPERPQSGRRHRGDRE